MFNIIINNDRFKDTALSSIPTMIQIMGFYVMERIIPNNEVYETVVAGLKLEQAGTDTKTSKDGKITMVIKYVVDEPIKIINTMTKEKYDIKIQKALEKPKTNRKNKKGEDIITKPKKVLLDTEIVSVDGKESVKLVYESKRSKFIAAISKDIKSYWIILVKFYINDIVSFSKETGTFEELVERYGKFSKFIFNVSKLPYGKLYNKSIFDEKYQNTIEEKYNLAFGQLKNQIGADFATIKDASTAFKVTCETVFYTFFINIVTEMLITRVKTGASLSSDLFFTTLYKYYFQYIDEEFNFEEFENKTIEYFNMIPKKTVASRSTATTTKANIGVLTTETEKKKETYEEVPDENLNIEDF